MFAVPMWENQDTETATCQQSEVTDAKLPIISQNVKTLPKRARGRIIRQGIKFNSFQEFRHYVDGGQKIQVLRKEKRDRKYDNTGHLEDSDVHRSKKQKFNAKKLNDMLSEDKGKVSSVNSPVTPIKLSNSEAKLRTSRFRYLNQQLYTQTGEASFKVSYVIFVNCQNQKRYSTFLSDHNFNDFYKFFGVLSICIHLLCCR